MGLPCLVALEAQSQGNDEDGEGERVDERHAEPDAHSQLESSGNLGKEMRGCIGGGKMVDTSRFLYASRFLPTPPNLSRAGSCEEGKNEN